MTSKKSILDAANKTLPKLNYAVELQHYAATVGFDWPNISSIADKVQEELNEVMAETDIPNNQVRLIDEIGDLLFACTNLARHLNIDPEQALAAGNKKFHRRFMSIETLIEQQGKDIKQCTLAELDTLWEQVKLAEKIKAC